PPLGETVGHTPLESIRHLRPSQVPQGDSMNRTLLLWQEADISKVGGHGRADTLITASILK
ncbi:MAG: hypothetical protein NW202_09760, partial [Nitrospira sp.]|nr:hypothetical protein [Nitrospira sp.]